MLLLPNLGAQYDSAQSFAKYVLPIEVRNTLNFDMVSASPLPLLIIAISMHAATP